MAATGADLGLGFPVLGPSRGLGVVLSAGERAGKITEIAASYGYAFVWTLWVKTEVCDGCSDESSGEDDVRAVTASMCALLKHAGVQSAPSPGQAKRTDLRILGQHVASTTLRWGSYETGQCCINACGQPVRVSLRAHNAPLSKLVLVDRAIRGLVCPSGRPAIEFIEAAAMQTNADPQPIRLRPE